MKNVTVTIDEALPQRARVGAVRAGKSLSRSIAEAVERRAGRPMTRLEGIERSVGGPSLRLLDRDGKAPTRDQIHGD